MAICHGLTRFIYDADKIQGFSQDIALSTAVDGTAESRVRYKNMFSLGYFHLKSYRIWIEIFELVFNLGK